MKPNRPRILYLSNAFPPGVTGRFPSLNPAGHATETRFIQALSRIAQIRTVGHLPAEVRNQLEPRDDSFGVEHEYILWEGRTRVWHDWLAWRELRDYYTSGAFAAEPPDVVLVRNLTPVFNRFVRWLRRQTPRPAIVLVLADSSTLGLRVPIGRRLRYKFKPMQTMDDVAIRWYDACIGFGVQTRRYFEPRGIPWMWMPSAPNFNYTPPEVQPERTGPIRFGYFGSLAEHAAVLPTAQTFLKAGVEGPLHMCGFGRLSEVLRELAAEHPNFHFDGLLQRQSDCLDWAQKVDVLINPRLTIWGLHNSFPSKIFEYGMTGRAILTTRTGGVDRILAEHGLYLETDGFEESLRQKLVEIGRMKREDLDRRGAAIRERLMHHFNWDIQAARMVRFFEALVEKRPMPESIELEMQER